MDKNRLIEDKDRSNRRVDDLLMKNRLLEKEIDTIDMEKA